MQKFFFYSLLLLILTTNLCAQNSLIGKYYWTKFVLASDGDCRVEITPKGIPTYQKDCWFLPDIEANSKIKLEKIIVQKSWSKLTFYHLDTRSSFLIYLKNDTKKIFQKSFDFAFSKKPVSKDKVFPSCNIKTRLDLVRKIGFPDFIKRKNEAENWVYKVGWIGGQPCSYDETYIEVKNGLVSKISGIV